MDKKINNEDLKKSVYEINKDASESTKKTYFTSFNRFFKHLNNNKVYFDSFEEFLKYLTVNFKTLIEEMKVENNNSIENLMKAIVKYNRLLKLEDTEEFKNLSNKFTKMIGANKILREENLKNNKTKNIVWQDVVDYFNENIKDSANIDIIDKIIMSFYINNPPLRSSNFHNLIYRNYLKTKEPFNLDFNYYIPFLHIVKISNDKLKVKTENDYLNIKIDEITSNLLNELIKKIKPENNQILWNYNTNTFTAKINGLLTKHFYEIFGDNISVNTLRHLFTSSIDINNLNLRQMKRYATRINQKHIDQFLLYRQIKDDKNFTVEKINKYIDDLLEGKVEKDNDIEKFLDDFVIETNNINEKLDKIDLTQHRYKPIL